MVGFCALIGSVVAGESNLWEPPPRPDLTTLSKEEAQRALAKYDADRKAWDEAQRPLREQAIKEAIAVQVARKKQREARVALEEAGLAWRPSQTNPAVQVAPDYAWEKDAAAQKLSAEAVAKLKQHGLVIAGGAFRQSFEVYADESVVPFVTTDSLLNGFHVLLEASLRKYEQRRARELREALETVWGNLDRRLAASKLERAQVAPFVDHLARVIGPALRLLGSDVALGGEEVEADVAAVVKLIEVAAQPHLPAWMGPPESSFLAIDFRRCRPIGFYAEGTTLSNYYRAVRWLQLVPLRASRNVEVGAAAVLAGLEKRLPEGVSNFVRRGEGLWGRAGGASFASFAAGWSEFFDQLSNKSEISAALDGPRKRIVTWGAHFSEMPDDRLRLEGKSEEYAAITILTPTVLPDAKFLAEIGEARGPISAQWSPGLEVGAWLGSAFAMQRLEAESGPGLAGAVSKIRATESEERYFVPDENSPLPDLYYEMLKTLLQPPDPAAPDLMRSDAWQQKSLQTALAGWAQLRHTWELQSKLNVATTGSSVRPVGFIEPNPNFFRRMAVMQMAVVSRLQSAGVFSESSGDEAEYLKECLAKMRRAGVGKIEVDLTQLDFFDQDFFLEMAWNFWVQAGNLEVGGIRELRGAAQLEFWRKIMTAIQTRIEKLEAGVKVPRLELRDFRDDPDNNLFYRWQRLQGLTSQLEAMAQKQLRGADWNEAEATTLRDYNERLGEVMGYFSSAAMDPNDDAPRWTTVHYDPATDVNRAVAIGRPRALYVLYPWKGKQILCRGAVMPFFDYPSGELLTDETWKKQLDGPSAPAQPEWLEPITSGDGKPSRN